MKLIELIEYLTNESKLAELYRQQGIEKDAEDLTIFMQSSLNMDSNVMLFEDDETGGRTRFEKDGVSYIEFMPLDIAIEYLESALDLRGAEITNLDKAKSLLHYAIYDA